MSTTTTQDRVSQAVRAFSAFTSWNDLCQAMDDFGYVPTIHPGDKDRDLVREALRLAQRPVYPPHQEPVPGTSNPCRIRLRRLDNGIGSTVTEWYAMHLSENGWQRVANISVQRPEDAKARKGHQMPHGARYRVVSPSRLAKCRVDYFATIREVRLFIADLHARFATL